MMLMTTTLYSWLAIPPSLSILPFDTESEGIYILCDDQRSDFPRHLRAKVVDSASFEQCKWKIVSGPINTSPTDLQMRACTPASGVGKRGHLWTRVRACQPVLVILASSTS